MFSKALFKQSAKANWMRWLTVTVATCVMLAIVIIVLGNLAINDIRDSLKNVFVQADQESSLKEEAVDAYELYMTSVDTYNQTASFSGMLGVVTNTYDGKVNTYKNENDGAEPSDEQKQIYIEETATQYSGFAGFVGMEEAELKAYITSILNFYITKYDATKDEVLFDQYFLEQVYTEAYTVEIAKEDATVESATERANSAKEIAAAAISQYKTDASAQDYEYKRENYVSYATNYVNNTIMYDNVYKMQIQAGATEDEAKEYAVTVKVISNTAISTYELWLVEYENQNADVAITAEQKADAKSRACESITDQIPEKVGEALSELGNMDMYGLIIGSIFYRIAGLLLPMVFVIMTANSLLAGQVDSGSMAYVLSTPTKRRTVTVTQMMYLLWSLFAMYAILTVISVISVWVVGGNSFAINFGEILLFNLGAFLTMFAFAGFCFMCSAIFNRSKHSLSIGGGLTIFMLVCTILGLFGSDVVPSAMRIDAMNFFNYLSIISFFDTVSILNGTLSYLWKFGILLAIGVVTFIIGVFRFDKKDLPL